MILADVKKNARAEAQARRHQRSERSGPADSDALARQALACGAIEQGDTIAGYWPIGEEIDIRPLLLLLAERGYDLLLPSVEERAAPLTFRAWRPGDDLVAGPLGTRQPATGQPEATPDLMLVPMLAFDADGYRLGYGGGYYDRTIARLRPGGARAAGLAYEAQRIDHVPRDEKDMRLDWTITEQSAHRIDAAGEHA